MTPCVSIRNVAMATHMLRSPGLARSWRHYGGISNIPLINIAFKYFSYLQQLCLALPPPECDANRRTIPIAAHSPLPIRRKNVSEKRKCNRICVFPSKASVSIYLLYCRSCTNATRGDALQKEGVLVPSVASRAEVSRLEDFSKSSL
jgi:hypothetical protein